MLCSCTFLFFHRLGLFTLLYFLRFGQVLLINKHDDNDGDDDDDDDELLRMYVQCM